ncbi:hypothetical protein AC1031_021967 [Aphanomyces cochlioides]|nr:hypothetical protein AC1031_021967 [Aphanomyces cochlioides]
MRCLWRLHCERRHRHHSRLWLDWNGRHGALPLIFSSDQPVREPRHSLQRHVERIQPISVHLHAPHHPRHNAVRFFWHICHFVRRGVRRVLYYVPRQEHPSSPRVHPRARFQLLRPNPEGTDSSTKMRSNLLQKPTLLLDGLKKVLHTNDLWHFAFYFGWLSLIFSFTGGAIPSIISRTAGADTDAINLYTNYLFPIISNSTFVFAPLVGYCIDKFGFRGVFDGCLALTQLFLATLLVPVLEIQLLGFVFCSMAQSSLYTLQFAYISTSVSHRLHFS